ncbi:unnamed protein product [Microthlaspi erraticum]|uniref:G-patch domain-containing protein n=1 Tax=Microthlaspi erraticum TaxID=1685480 RepID=A0A6D2JGZ1_9BRAS|nr:unnamed protein product [Microthlaspi erraticum]
MTEFDPDTKPRHVIIPPIENRWKDKVIRKNINLPLEFVADDDIPSHGSDNIAYGLTLRQDKPEPKPEHVEEMLLKSMRKDLESLPDAPDLEDFESVPVEGFGAALLAGYGWKPGQGIGLNAKEDVPIVEYNKWSGTQGFGFKLNPDKPSVKSSKEIAFKGKKGVKEIKNVEKCRTVNKRSRETDCTQVRDCGRLYLKKAVVTDVVGPTSCDITMDEMKEVVRGIDQELLETALPRRGGHVLVLSGRHKGVYGSLVEKDLDQETGVVCDAESKEMFGVKLAQVAEYMGDPGDIGY